MEYRFQALIQGHNALDVVERSAMRLLEAFEDRHPKAGPSVGMDLHTRVLEVSFSAGGDSHEAATEHARRMLLQVVDASGLTSTDLIGFAGNLEATEQALAS